MSQQRLHPSRRDLTKGAITPHMLRLALPMGWGIMAIISFSLVDTWFISRLGTDQLAAIGFTMPVTMFVFNVIFSISIAMSSVAARKIGEGAREEVRSIATIGLALVMIAALACAVLGHLVMRPLFALLGADETVYAYIESYLLIWLYGSFFLGLPVVANAVIRGAGDTFWPAMVMTCVAVVNAILSPLLIFGLFGFPRLEMQGAALSTVLSYMISAVVALGILHYRERCVCLPALLRKACWGRAVKALMVIAIPVALASTIIPVLGAILTAWFADYGAAAVAGFGVAVRLETFMLIPAMAVGSGIGPLAGQNWGAGHFDRLQEVIRKATWFCVMFGLLATIMMVLGARPIAALFTNDPVAFEFAILFMQIVPIGYIALFYVQTLGSILNAIGKPVQALALNAAKAFLMIVPFVWFGQIVAGPSGMFVGIAVAHLLAGIIMLFIIKAIKPQT